MAAWSRDVSFAPKADINRRRSNGPSKSDRCIDRANSRAECSQRQVMLGGRGRFCARISPTAPTRTPLRPGRRVRMARRPEHLEFPGKREFSLPIPTFSSRLNHHTVQDKPSIRNRLAICQIVFGGHELGRPLYFGTRTLGGAFMSPRSSGNAAPLSAAQNESCAQGATAYRRPADIFRL